MSDKLTLPPASQTSDGIEVEAAQETGVDSKSVVAYGQPDHESIRLLLSLSPDNSLRHRNLHSEGTPGENVQTNDHATHDVNLVVTPLSDDSKSQEQPKENNANCSDEPTTCSDEEPLRKPVEATDTPTGGTSALVPSSSPPKSDRLKNDMAKLLKTYDIVNIPTPPLVDPADQHRIRNVDARARRRQPTTAQSQDRSSGALVESIEGKFLIIYIISQI